MGVAKHMTEFDNTGVQMLSDDEGVDSYALKDADEDQGNLIVRKRRREFVNRAQMIKQAIRATMNTMMRNGRRGSCGNTGF